MPLLLLSKKNAKALIRGKGVFKKFGAADAKNIYYFDDLVLLAQPSFPDKFAWLLTNAIIKGQEELLGATSPLNIKKSIYSLPEITGKKIKDYNIIACPGCYPTSILLPLNLRLNELLPETVAKMFLKILLLSTNLLLLNFNSADNFFKLNFLQKEIIFFAGIEKISSKEAISSLALQ